MSSSTLLDLINKKKSKLKAKGEDFKPLRPPMGKHVFRILPTWRSQSTDKDGEPFDPVFWHDFSQHWIKANEEGKQKVKAVYTCYEKTMGEECPVCTAFERALQYARDTGDEELENLIYQSRSVQKYLLNVLWLSNPDESMRDTPLVMEVGKTIFVDLLEIMEAFQVDAGIDILDVEKGVDIIIERSGSGRDTSYSVIASPKGSTKRSYRGNLNNLDDIVKAALDRNDATRSVKALSAAAGIPAPKVLESDDAPVAIAAPESSTADASSKDGIDEVEKAVVEELADVSPASESSSDDGDIDDSELDDLLASIGS